jgi:hypothetical protein
MPQPGVPASLMPRVDSPAAEVAEAVADGPPPWRAGASAPAPRETARPTSVEEASEAVSAAALAATNGHRPLSRELELLLDEAALAEARTVAIDLQVRDASDRVLHQIRDLAWDLAEQPDSDDVRLQLQIALRPKP